MFLIDFENKLKKCISEDVVLTVGVHEVSKNEESILLTIIRPQFRFIVPYSTSSVDISLGTKEGYYIMEGHISEFPKCCGKAIFHGFKLFKYMNLGNSRSKSLNDETFDSIMSDYLNTVVEIAKHARYSSVDMIVSQEEQNDIYESMKRLKYEPVGKFINKRFKNWHNCFTYTLDTGLE